MRHSQCDVLLTCCTVILRFEDGRIKAQYPMDAAGAEKVKHFFAAKPDAQEEKELTTTKNNNNTRIGTPEQQPLPGAALAFLLAVPSAFMGLKRQGITF